MKKIKNHLLHGLLAGIMFFILAGCGPVTPSPTGTPDWQPLPTFSRDVFPSDSSNLRHYVPSKELNFHLEFDYPGNWWLNEYVDDIGLPSVFLGDQRFLTLATPASVDFHPTPNDFGSISIWVWPTEPGQTADSELKSLKESYNKINRMTVLGDYKVAIDGYDAAILEYEVDDPEFQTSIMFNRRVFFVAGEQFYEILFEVAVKDRGGEFEKGYEQFFKSLNIIE